MCLLLESIKVLNGRLYNLHYHHQRMQQARQALFGLDTPCKLEEMEVPVAYRQGLVKCRVLYRQAIQEVTFTPYQKISIHTLRLVFDDHIDYTYKYADRKHLEQLYTRKGATDDILVVRNGLITDTMYGNIAFFDGNQWHTPANPLLCGTQRQKLLEAKMIWPTIITVDDIQRYRAFKVFNALNEFEDQPQIDITQIVQP